MRIIAGEGIRIMEMSMLGERRRLMKISAVGEYGEFTVVSLPKNLSLNTPGENKRIENSK
jgi:hypothetical protein